MRKSASDPIGTLSVGNAINAAVALYKSHFRDYFSLAVRAVGWLFLGIVAAAPVVIVGIITSNIGITTLAGVVWLGFFIFCTAKYLLNRGIMSRFAYQQLIDQPETVASVTLQLARSHWKFLGLSLWLGLFIFGVILLAYLALLIFIGLGALIASQIPSPIGSIIAAILITFGVVAAVWIFLRFYSSWFVAELPLAVEKYSGGLDAIGRSRQLSAPFTSRILMIIFVAFLIVLPLEIISNVPSLATLGQATSNPTVYAVSQVIGLLLSLVLEMFIMPFWQIIKAVVYFDLLGRREGHDLQMR
jgi:hypothetical protein